MRRKLIASFLAGLLITGVLPVGVNAEWRHDNTGWWYADGYSWYRGWKAVDGKLYYFSNDGYMLHTNPNEFSPVYELNSSGQFTNVIVDGDWAYCKVTGEIVAYLGSDSNVVIPNNIKGFPVATIGYKAFYGHKNLVSITIPNSVYGIERDAFYGCDSLTTINIPASVIFMEKSALFGCEKLSNIIIDDNNRTYKNVDGVIFSKDGTQIIYYPSTKEAVTYKVPDNVTRIEDNAFYECSNLTSIEMPNSITSIGTAAFYKCTKLTNINIPGSVTSIGEAAFDGCSSLTNISIPEGVTTLGRCVFEHCTNLKSITIPNSIVRIEGNAFEGCDNAMIYVKSEATKQILINYGIAENKITVSAS